MHSLGREVFPKSLQALCAAEQSAEYGGIGKQNIARPGTAWGHPRKRIELSVASLCERMWPGQVDGLAAQNMNAFAVFCCEGVVRQMHVEIEARDSVQPAPPV